MGGRTRCGVYHCESDMRQVSHHCGLLESEGTVSDVICGGREGVPVETSSGAPGLSSEGSYDKA